MDIMDIIYVYASVHINHLSVPIHMQDTDTIPYNIDMKICQLLIIIWKIFSNIYYASF